MEAVTGSGGLGRSEATSFASHAAPRMRLGQYLGLQVSGLMKRSYS